MIRCSRAALLLLAASTLVACTDEETTSPSPPVDIEVGGGFRVALHGGARLQIASSDGRVLLDGLPPGEVAEGEPPLVGFAVADISTSYEMQFGAFKPTEHENG